MKTTAIEECLKYLAGVPTQNGGLNLEVVLEANKELGHLQSDLKDALDIIKRSRQFRAYPRQGDLFTPFTVALLRRHGYIK